MNGKALPKSKIKSKTDIDALRSTLHRAGTRVRHRHQNEDGTVALGTIVAVYISGTKRLHARYAVRFDGCARTFEIQCHLVEKIVRPKLTAADLVMLRGMKISL